MKHSQLLLNGLKLVLTHKILEDMGINLFFSVTVLLNGLKLVLTHKILEDMDINLFFSVTVFLNRVETCSNTQKPGRYEYKLIFLSHCIAE
jgi:uncharacterized membrane protein